MDLNSFPIVMQQCCANYNRLLLGIIAALVLGGVDRTGSYIYSIGPHGSSDKLPYATMGSGTLAAMAVFEAHRKPDMFEEEGKKLFRDAIAAGVFNDFGSGSNVDLCVIREDSADYLRGYEVASKNGERQLDYTFKAGTTAVLKTEIQQFDINEEIRFVPMKSMDTA
uniref:Proteasome beta subunit C-terminal domain-containing protein n=1 Tax=Glossina brevipalpis TaxID=37001 RepID=A0A1A9WQL8_9MUSC